MTTLENSYCIPRTVEEWRQLGADKSWEFREGSVVYTSKPVSADVDIIKHFSNEVLAGPVMKSRTEIPVSRFIDLLHDRIVPWRLEEVGFMHTVRGIYELNVNPHGHFTLEYCEGFIYVSAGRISITTFTDLLTLIRFLTPPTE